MPRSSIAMRWLRIRICCRRVTIWRCCCRLSKDRQSEAIDLWKQNLAAKPDYLPSRLALAELLAARGDAAGAIEQYRAAIAQTPEYLAARVALAGQLVKAKQPEAALEQLRAAVKLDDQNASLWEQIGDIENTLNHTAEAREAYAAALKLESRKCRPKTATD